MSLRDIKIYPNNKRKGLGVALISMYNNNVELTEIEEWQPLKVQRTHHDHEFFHFRTSPEFDAVLGQA